MNSSDQAYIKILEDRMKQITEQINKLRTKKISLLSFNNLIDMKIKGLEVEYNKIKEQVNNKVDHIEVGKLGEKILEKYDERINSNNTKKEEYQNTINELNELRKNVKTRRGQEAIRRKIKKANDKIKCLENKNVKMQKTQRVLLYPKYLYMQRRQRKIDRAEGRVAFNEERYNDNEVIKATANTNTIRGAIKHSYYDIRGAFYLKRYERSKELLEKMNKKYSPTRVKGCRIIKIKNNIKNRIRNMTKPAPAPGPTPAPAPSV